MKGILSSAFLVTVALLTTGCAHNSIVGDGAVASNRYFGDVGIWGDGSTVTVLRGSKLNKLSILGNDNNVTVQDTATINHIEFWGKRNTVSIPEDLIVRTSEVGRNQIIRRVRQPITPNEWAPPIDTLTPPPADTQTPPPPTDDNALYVPAEPDANEPAPLD